MSNHFADDDPEHLGDFVDDRVSIIGPDGLASTLDLERASRALGVDPAEVLASAKRLRVSVRTVCELARMLGVRPDDIAFVSGGKLDDLATQIAGAVMDTIERNGAIVKAQIAEAIEQALASNTAPRVSRLAAVAAR